jgi:hypothetical protein
MGGDEIMGLALAIILMLAFSVLMNVSMVSFFLKGMTNGLIAFIVISTLYIAFLGGYMWANL